jgi:hypothetical protein
MTDLRYCAMHGRAVFVEVNRVNRIIRFIRLSFFLSCLLWAGGALAMDRFTALSMIESGDDDFARGQLTEVSRYQIRRELWLVTTNVPISQATNPAVALAVAQVIAAKRCQLFEAKYGRAPTDFEFYILWNAPSQIDNPRQAVRARATRFVNLVERKD